MKNITLFLIVLVTFLFSVAETSAQITPPYYNPANVRITGGTINGTVIGGTTAAAGNFTALSATTTATTDGVTALRSEAGASIGTAYAVQGISNGASGFQNIGVYATAANAAINNYSIYSNAGIIKQADATNSTSTTTGSLITAGGLGVAKKAYFGDSINIAAPGTISVGSGSGTSAGLIAGYHGSSGYGSIWGTAVTPSTSNYSFATNGATTIVNGTSTANFNINGANVLQATNTSIIHVGNMIYDKTITTAGTTGAETINKTTGRVNFAAAATSLVVTNSLATANSICHVTKATNDATMRLGACVAAAGSITIYADVAPAAETAVNFTITN